MIETIIRPQSGWKLLDLKAIWEYRELFYIFAWRDIKVRYRQTLLGILWVILQPLTSMTIFTVLFGRYAKIPSGDLPYALFVLIGLVFWNFFSNAVISANESLLAHENIIKKVYFPKVILPLAAVVTSFVDFCINTLLIIAFSYILGYPPHWQFVIVFPLCVLITCATASGLGLFLSSMNVKYRDVRYLIPHFIQILFFFTPVIYPLSIVSSVNRIILALNPLSTVIELLRTAFTGGNFPFIHLLFVSGISTLFVCILGVWHFTRTERFFADIL